MTFLWSKLLQSLVKKLVLVVVGIITGPKLSVWLTTFGVTIDPVQLQAGIFLVLEGLRGWLTHQSWSAKLPKTLLSIL